MKAYLSSDSRAFFDVYVRGVTAGVCDIGASGAALGSLFERKPDPSANLASTCGAAICGNGIQEGSEDCDDGNTNGGDCCSATCQYEVASSPCDDGDACTSPDACDGADSCTSGAPLTCDDTNSCTDDSCIPASGCVFANNTDPCDDGNACTSSDTCSSGSCQSGPPPKCDDFDPCTADSCNMVGGCSHDPIVECVAEVPASSHSGRLFLLAMMILMAVFALSRWRITRRNS